MKIRLLIAIVFIGLLATFIYYNESKIVVKKPEFKSQITYSSKTYNPYDIKFIHDVFTKNSQKPDVENSESITISNEKWKGTNNLLAIFSPQFLPLKSEIKKMITWVHSGNTIFISSFNYNHVFINSLLFYPNFDDIFLQTQPFPPNLAKDSLQIFIQNGANSTQKNKQIFGYNGSNPTYNYDLLESQLLPQNVLSRDTKGHASLIKIPVGKGFFYLNLQAITLSNYFLLHKDNYQYTNEISKITGLKNKNLIWDNFYKKHREARPEPENFDKAGQSYFWKVIGEYPSLIWAIITFFIGILLFIFNFGRAIEKPIEVIPDIGNNSIDFVKAISGLYWLKQDHKKIAEKIIIQFHDYLFNNFKIKNSDISLQNTEKIAEKIGVPASELKLVLQKIEFTENSEKINKKTLIHLYSSIYKITNT